MAASIKDAGEGSSALGKESQKQLQGLAERIQNLFAERKELNESITEVFDEAREAGFDTKILRKAVKEIAADQDKARAEREMVDTYKAAIQPDLFSSTRGAPASAPAEREPAPVH